MGFNEVNRKEKMPKDVLPIKDYPGCMANSPATVIVYINDGELSVLNSTIFCLNSLFEAEYSYYKEPLKLRRLFLLDSVYGLFC